MLESNLLLITYWIWNKIYNYICHFNIFNNLNQRHSWRLINKFFAYLTSGNYRLVRTYFWLSWIITLKWVSQIWSFELTCFIDLFETCFTNLGAPKCICILKNKSLFQMYDLPDMQYLTIGTSLNTNFGLKLDKTSQYIHNTIL